MTLNGAAAGALSITGGTLTTGATAGNFDFDFQNTNGGTWTGNPTGQFGRVRVGGGTRRGEVVGGRSANEFKAGMSESLDEEDGDSSSENS